jgi:hypothetical protein
VAKPNRLKRGVNKTFLAVKLEEVLKTGLYSLYYKEGGWKCGDVKII